MFGIEGANEPRGAAASSFTVIFNSLTYARSSGVSLTIMSFPFVSLEGVPFAS